MNPEYEIEILLVEDSPYDAELTIRELTRRHLANKLVHLKDGAEALDFIFSRGISLYLRLSPLIIESIEKFEFLNSGFLLTVLLSKSSFHIK